MPGKRVISTGGRIVGEGSEKCESKRHVSSRLHCHRPTAEGSVFGEKTKNKLEEFYLLLMISECPSREEQGTNEKKFMGKFGV